MSSWVYHSKWYTTRSTALEVKPLHNFAFIMQKVAFPGNLICRAKKPSRPNQWTCQTKWSGNCCNYEQQHRTPHTSGWVVPSTHVSLGHTHTCTLNTVRPYVVCTFTLRDRRLSVGKFPTNCIIITSRRTTGGVCVQVLRRRQSLKLCAE